MSPPPLEWPRAATGSSVIASSTANASRTSASQRVQGGALAVAVAPLVPGDDPPAGVGEQRREQVEGGGEVEAAVGQEQRAAVRVAPLVDGDGRAVGIDRAARRRVGGLPGR